MEFQSGQGNEKSQVKVTGTEISIIVWLNYQSVISVRYPQILTSAHCNLVCFN